MASFFHQVNILRKKLPLYATKYLIIVLSVYRLEMAVAGVMISWKIKINYDVLIAPVSGDNKRAHLAVNAKVSSLKCIAFEIVIIKRPYKKEMEPYFVVTAIAK